MLFPVLNHKGERFARSLFVFLTLFLCLTLSTTTKASDPPRQKALPLLDLTTPDYHTNQLLEKAFALLQTGRYAQAIPLLQSLIDSDSDCFLLPEQYEFAKSVKWRSGNVDTHSDTLVGIIRDTLARLPDKGKEIYSFLHEKPVRDQLNDAVSRHDLPSLYRLGTRYFPTIAGREAAWLAASQFYAQGKSLPALQLIEPFESLPFEASSPFEPELSIMMADLFVKYGQYDRAKQRLDALSHAMPEILSNDGKSHSAQSLFDLYVKYHSGNDTDLNSINILSSMMPWGASRIPPIPKDSRPILLSGKNQSGMTYDPNMLPLLMKGIAVPTQTPTADGDTVIFRDRFDLVALDTISGKQKWRCSPIDISLPETTVQSATTTIDENWNRIGNAWSCYNALSNCPVANHGIVYSLEFPLQSEQFNKLLLHSAEEAGTAIVLPEYGNTLVARSVANGAVLWQVGQVPYCNNLILAVNALHDTKKVSAEEWSARLNELRSKYFGETIFCSIPLILDGKVHLCGYNHGEIAWFVFDARTGKTLRRTPLIQNTLSPLDLQSVGLCHETPVARDGIAVCVAGNWLIALDYEFGRLLWSYRWNKPAENLHRGTIPNIENHLTNALNNRNPLVRHRLLFFKQFVLFYDSIHSALYCIDPYNGHLLWKHSAPDTLEIFSMSSDKLLIAAKDGLYETTISRDKCNEFSIVVKYDDDQVPLGEGCLAGNLFLQPLQNGKLACIDLENKSVQYQDSLPGPEGITYGGNLFAFNNKIGWQSWSRLYLLNIANTVPDSIAKDEWKQPLTCNSRLRHSKCPWITEPVLWNHGKITGHKGDMPIPEVVFYGSEMYIDDSLHVCSCINSCRFFWNESQQSVNIFNGDGKCIETIPVIFNKNATMPNASDNHRFTICDGQRLIFLVRDNSGKFLVTDSVYRREAQPDHLRLPESHSLITQFQEEIHKRMIHRPLNVTQSDSISAWIDDRGIIQLAGADGVREQIYPASNEVFLHVALFKDKICAIANRYLYGKRKEKQPTVGQELHILDISLETGKVIKDKPWNDSAFAMDRIICSSKPESYFLQVSNIDTPDKPILSGTKSNQRWIVRPCPGNKLLAVVLGETFHLFDTIQGSMLFKAKIPYDRIKSTLNDIIIQREKESFLVMFCFPADQNVVYDSFVPIAHLTEKSIPRTLMMRFDTTGKPLWSEYVFMEQTCPFKINSANSPVYLFGKEVGKTKDNSAYRVITAIDRATGKRRFQAKIPMSTQQNQADSENGVWIDSKEKSVLIRLGRELYQFREGES